MRKVLFVDDDEEDMFLFDKAMNKLYIHSDIYYAVCRDDLYYLLEAANPDLVFLNINLPDLNGFDCLERLRLVDTTSLLPIIIYSAFTNVQMIDRCFELKANYFIIKPKDVEKLVSLLRKVFSINWLTDRFPLRQNFVIG